MSETPCDAKMALSKAMQSAEVDVWDPAGTVKLFSPQAQRKKESKANGKMHSDAHVISLHSDVSVMPKFRHLSAAPRQVPRVASRLG